MSSIVGIDQMTQQQASSTMQGSSIMGKDDFLRLLTIQLKYQDPMSPMNSEQFASQLAQYSQIEALNNINEGIATQTIVNQSMNNSFMINMIGKDVMSYGDIVTLNGEKTTLDFQLYADAASVKVRIFDDTGKEVSAFEAGALKGGDRKVTWDGMTKEGIKAADGTYTFTVEAFNKEGISVPVDTMNNGIVTGVVYEGGMPYLLVNGSYVSLGDIVSVNQAKKEE
ncbi:MAG: hypothetical protein FWG20_05310 [Candidatus Cloacimonetes bacterium]|nr:hypothetical protein [Candidatus Cloacimonadota bacterium]